MFFIHRKTIKILRVFSYALFLLTTIDAANAYTENNEVENHERWYQVEMIIFSRNNSNSDEAWPKDIKLSYPNNLISLKTSSNDFEGINVLDSNERKLNALAATLIKNGNYTLLFHQAWRQMIYGRKTNILINGGKTFNGHQELEGSISLSVAQYLKLQTNLWLTQFSPLGELKTDSITADAWPELPSLHAPSESDKTNDALVTRIVKINQQRSMRSVEVHYIDHPLLGIIIKIIPSDQPIIKTNK